MADRPIRYLKNAWVRKDAEGDYWLHIESDGLSAMFCFTETLDLNEIENEEIHRALVAWYADQDSGNGNTSSGREPTPK